MSQLTTGQLATALTAAKFIAPDNWRGITDKQAQDRIRQAVAHGHLIPCGKIGNYNLFDNETIWEWVNGGCQYASKRVNEEAGE